MFSIEATIGKRLSRARGDCLVFLQAIADLKERKPVDLYGGLPDAAQISPKGMHPTAQGWHVACLPWGDVATRVHVNRNAVVSMGRAGATQPRLGLWQFVASLPRVARRSSGQPWAG